MKILALLLLLPAAAQADPITYLVDRELGSVQPDFPSGMRITGQLTTDGTLGDWIESHLIDFDLLFTFSGYDIAGRPFTDQNTVHILPTNGGAGLSSGIQATEQALFWNGFWDGIDPVTQPSFLIGGQNVLWYFLSGDCAPGCALEFGHGWSLAYWHYEPGYPAVHAFALVPEPGTATLLALGLIGLHSSRPRRLRRAGRHAHGTTPDAESRA